MVRFLRLGTIGLALAAAFAPTPAVWVEFGYSRYAYLSLQRWLTTCSNAVPIAVTDLLIAGAVAGVAIGVVRWRRVCPIVGVWRASGHAALVAGTTVAAIYLLFLAVWGLNYRREPLGARLDFDRARVTPASVLELTTRVVERTNAIHAKAHADGWPAWEALPAVLGPAFARVQRQLADVRPVVPGIPKRSLLTYYFERAGVSGLTNPFALEVVVDRSQLPVERPFVVAHEWAHLAGYASEAEANFVGWLVCLQGPPSVEYSGSLVLLMHLLNTLPSTERAGMIQALGAGPQRDIRDIQRRASRGWPWLQRPVWWVYDRYLHANRVELGVRSYGAALELFVGTRFGAHWVPGRKPEVGS